MRGSKERLKHLVEEREHFLKYLQTLNSQVQSGEMESRERNFLLELKTKGIPPNIYLDRLNNQILHTSRHDETRERVVRHASIAAGLFLFLAMFFYAFINPTLTGLAGLGNEQEYVLKIDANYTNGTTEYYFNVLDVANNTNNLTSVRITGKHSGQLVMKLVSSIDGINSEYVIYESSKPEDSGNLITGYAVKESKDTIEINETIDEPVEDEQEITIPEENITEPETVEPEVNATEPLNVIEPTINVTEPELNITPDINETLNETTNETGLIEEFIIPFTTLTDECIETCDIDIPPYNLSIVIEVVDGEFYLEEIAYTQETIDQAPVQLKDIPDIYGSTILDLSEYFYDPEGNTLSYDVMSNPDVEYTLDGDILNITPISLLPQEFYIYVTDGEEVITSNTFMIYPQSIIPQEVLEALARDGSVRIMVKTSVDAVTVVPDQGSKQLKTAGLSELESASMKFVDKKVIVTKKNRPIEIKRDVDGLKSVVVDSELLNQIAQMPETEQILLDEQYSTLTGQTINITRINAVKDAGYSGQGIKICILDTGLSDALGIDSVGYNFVDNIEYYDDGNGHGTNIAYSLKESAPNSDLIIAKVISDEGVGYASDIIAGLDYCAIQNASIISMSIGGGSSTGYCDADLVAQKVNELNDQGILVVVATGNDGSGDAVKIPSCASGALPVGATLKQGIIAPFSNYNNATLLVAPGVSITTKDVSGNDVIVSGTSMSVPFVTGTAALLLENAPLDQDEMKEILVHTGDLINHSGRQFAQLNAWNALIRNYTNNLSYGGMIQTNITVVNYTTLIDGSLSMSLVSVYFNNSGFCTLFGSRGMQYDSRGFFVVSVFGSDYITVLNVTNPLNVTCVGSVYDAAAAGSVDAVWWGTLDDVNKYFYTASTVDDIISIYNITYGNPVYLNGTTAAISANAAPSNGSLDNGYQNAYIDIAGTRFCLISAGVDDTVSVYNCTSTSTVPTPVSYYNVAANPCSVDNVRRIEFVPGTNIFIAASYDDDTISILNLSATGSISCISNVTDSAGANSLDTVQDFYFENSTKLIYALSPADGYMTIINATNAINSGGALSFVGSVANVANKANGGAAGTLGPIATTVVSVGSTKYAFVGSNNDTYIGIDILNVTNPASPSLHSNFTQTSGSCIYNATYSLSVVDEYLYVTSTEGCFYVIGLTAVEGVPNATRFNGLTTQFGSYTPQQLQNLSNVTLDINSYGRIIWNSAVNVSGADFDTHVDMGPGWISVNSSGLHQSINSSANITFYNAGGANLYILKDGQPCTTCTFVSYSGTSLTYLVEGFSNYSLTMNVTLTSPSNGDPSVSSPASFIADVADVTEIVNASLYTNESGWAAVETRWNGEIAWNSTGIISLYHFNNESALGENDTYIRDWSGNGINLSCDIDCPVYSSGKFGLSQYKSPSYNPFSAPDSNHYSNLSYLTVIAWVNPLRNQSAQGGDGFIVEKRHDGTGGIYNTYYLDVASNNQVVFHVTNETGATEYASGTTNNVIAGRWTMIAARYNGTNLDTFVNGVEDTSAEYPFAGRLFDGNDIVALGLESFNGSIDEISIWNRSLSDSEILALYNYSRTKFYPVFQERDYASEAAITWNVLAYDNVSNHAWASNYTFSIPSDIPAVELQVPTNGDSSVSSPVFFVSNASDNQELLNMTLYTNESGSWTAKETRWNGEVAWNDTGLVALYHFNNESAFGENSTRFRDFSPYGNNGSCSGTGCPTYNSSGRFGPAYKFDGINDLITFPNSDTYNNSDVITVSAWIYLNDNFSYSKGVISKYNNWALMASEEYNTVAFAPHFGVYAVDDNNENGAYFGTLLSKNTWYHIVGTYNGTHPFIYVNGVAGTTGEQKSGIYGSSNPLYAGAGPYGNGQYFNGTIDEVTIWTEYLNATQVMNLYNYSRTKFYPVFQDRSYGYSAAITWNVLAYDNLSNHAWASNYTFTIQSEGTPVSACQALSTPNTVYLLTTNVSINDANCFTITADNITLDCNGNNITGNYGGGTHGVLSAGEPIYNSTVKDCYISGFAYGIRYTYSINGTISNNTINNTASTSYGIDLYDYSDGIRVIGNDVRMTGGAGIAVSVGDVFIDCQGKTMLGTNDYGILYSGRNLSVNNCGIKGFNNGIYGYAGATRINVYNITMNVSASGIYLAGVHNSIIDNATIEARGSFGYGLELQVSSNVTASNLNITADESTNIGIGISESHNNTLRNVSILSSSVSQASLSIGDSTNNSIYNINIKGAAPEDVYLVNIGSTETYNNRIIGLSINNTGPSASINMYGFNTTIDCQGGIITGNSTPNTQAFNVNVNNGTIRNCIIKDVNIPLRFYNTENSSFTNNTLMAMSGGAGHVYIGSGSKGNIFILNNFTATTGYYLYAEAGGNHFNGTYEGKNQGNMWANVLDDTVSISGNVASSIPGLYLGKSGTGYPYNYTTSENKFDCQFSGCTDYAPLTYGMTPSITLVNPANHAIDNSPVTFLSSITDNQEIINATLYTNESGTLAAKETRWNGEIPYNMTDLRILFHFNNETQFGDNQTMFYDFSGNGNNGLCSGGCSGMWLNQGVYGLALDSLSATNNGVSVDDNGRYDNITQFTLSVWLKYNDYAVFPWALGRDSFYLRVQDNSTPGQGILRFRLYKSTGGQEDLSITTTLNNWTHLVIVLNGTALYYFQDGVKSAIDTWDGGPTLAGTGDFTIYGGGYNGSMDEFAFWNRSLTDAEAYAIYNYNRGSFYPVFQDRDLDKGTYIWNVFAYDNSSNAEFATSNYTFNTTTNPNVFLLNPANNSIINTSLNFISRVTDYEHVINATLYTNESGSWSPVETRWNGEIAWNSTGLVGLWHFNNESAFGENSTLIKDWSGNGNDLSSGASIPIFNPAGRFGAGYDVVGSASLDRYFYVADNPDFSGWSQMTVIAWIMPLRNQSDIGGNGDVISKRGNGTITWNMFYVRIGTNNRVEFSLSNDTYTSQANGATNAVSENQWVMIGARYNGTTLDTFVNGVEDTIGDYPFGGVVHDTTEPFYIAFPGSSFNGTVDEVVIFNRSLSSAEIFSLYNYSKKNFYPVFQKKVLSDGNYVWNVLAYDNESNNVWGSNYTFTMNTPQPVMINATVLPLIAYKNDTLMGYCNGTMGGTGSEYPVKYFYQWFVNGVANASGSTTSTSGTYALVSSIASTQLQKGQYWNISCRMEYLTLNSTWMNSSSAIINNSRPIVRAVTISPTLAYNDSTLIGYCNVTDSDLENIKYYYKWFKNGVLDSSGNTSFVMSGITTNIANVSASSTLRFENWTLECQAEDGTINSTAANVTKTIQNYLPTVSSVLLSSTSGNNYTTDNLTVTFTQADGDSDTLWNVTDWRRNGTSIALINMPFNTNISSNTSDAVLDYSTYGHHGTLGNGNNSRLPTWISDGKVGGAYRFNESQWDHIKVNRNNLVVNNSFTITAWYKITDLYNNYLFSIGDYDSLYYYIHGTYSYVSSNDDFGDVQITRASNYPINTWIFVAIVFSDTNTTIYENGTYMNSTPRIGDFTLDDDIYIGGRTDDAGLREDGSAQFFDGVIDEFIIWNRTLSQEQITALYQAGLSNNSLTTLVSQETIIGDVWTVFVTPSDGFDDGITLTSNQLTIVTSDVNPVVSLLVPPNGALSANTSWFFVSNVSDNQEVINASLYTNDSGSWIAKETRWNGEIPMNSSGLRLLLHFNNETFFGESHCFFFDFSGSGNNGTCSQEPTYSDDALFGRSLYFGPNEYDTVVVSNDPVFNSYNMTVALWVRGGEFDGGWTGFASVVNWSLAYQDNSFIFSMYDNYTESWKGSVTDGVVQNDTWYFFVGLLNYSVSANTSEVRTYLNGVEQSVVDTFPGVKATSVSDLEISSWNVSIDEFAYWDRALSSAEIMALYNYSKRNFYPVFQNRSLDVGVYVWNVLAFDNQSQSSWASNYSFTVGEIDAVPVVSLLAPPNGSLSPNTSWFFVSSVSDTHGVINASLYTNESGSWDAKETRWNGEIPRNSTGLVALYHFNNESAFGENATRVYDWSGKGNNGTCSGSGCPTYNSSGKFGSTYTFGSTDMMFNVGNNSILNPTQAITISAWVRYTQALNWLGVVAKDSDQLSYWLGLNDYSIDMIMSSTGSFSGYSETTGSTNLASNTWYHLAATYNGTHIRLYVNGQLDNTPLSHAGGIYSSSSYVAIGDSPHWSGNEFPGSIDEVAIWNRSLSDAEIMALYNYSRTNYYPVFQNRTLGNGNYIWNVLAFDNTSQSAWANNYSFTVGEIDTVPVVSLLTPPNGASSTNTSWFFVSNVSDNHLVINATLYTNESGSWAAKETRWNGEIPRNSTGLVALYHFNNESAFGENDTYIRDWSGNGVNLSCDIDCPVYSSGKFGLSQYNSPSYNPFSAPDGDYFTNLSYLTVIAWVNPLRNQSAQTGDGFIVGKRHDGTGGIYNTFYLQVYENNGVIFHVVNETGDGAEWTWGAVNSTLAGRWTMIAGRYNGTHLDTFVNGVRDTTAEYTFAGKLFNSNDVLVIGLESFNGSIDEVAIWNRSFSDAEMLAFYNYSKKNFYPVFQNRTLGNGTYIWNVLAFDNKSQSSWASNYSFTVNPIDTVPVVSLLVPPNGASSINVSWFFVSNVSDDREVVNATLYTNESGSWAALETRWNGEVPRNSSGLRLLLHFNNETSFNENHCFFFDFSGSGNNGTCAQEPTYSDNAVFGQSLYFGPNEYDTVIIPNNPVFNSYNMTVALWVRGGEFDGGWNGFASITNWSLAYQDNSFVFSMYDNYTGSWKGSFTDGVVQNDTWYFFVGLLNYSVSTNTSEVRTYLNGVEQSIVDVFPGVKATSVSDLEISSWNISIDEFAYWDRALSSAEILALYNYSRKNFYPVFQNRTFSAGVYVWNVLAFDNQSQNAWASSNYSFTVLPQSSCGDLTVANTVYSLNNDVSINGLTCFSIEADNVTLDCNGYSITGNNTPNTYGVYASYIFNATVRDCHIRTFYRGVFYDNGVVNSTVYNNTINITMVDGVGIYTNSDSSRINSTRNTLHMGSGEAMVAYGNGHIIDCQGSNMTGNGSSTGIFAGDSDYVNVKNCNINNFSAGIYFYSGATFFNISNSIIYANSGIALRLDDVHNSVLNNLTLHSESSDGLNIRTTHNVTASNVRISNKAWYGALMYDLTNSVLENISINTTLNGQTSFHFSWISTGAINNTINNITITRLLDNNAPISVTGYNNTFRRINIVQTGQAYAIRLDSEGANNQFDCQGGTILGGNNSEGVYSTQENTTIKNCRFEWWGNSIRLMGSSNGLFTNNTFIPKTGTTHIYLNGTATGNKFILNNFTDTSAVYVTDLNGGNHYNGTYEGKNQGNIWWNVMSGSVVITGNETSSVNGLFIGNNGSGYPYTNTTSSGKLSCNFAGCADYAPLTSTDENIPVINVVILNATTPGNYTSDNLTLYFTQTGTGNVVNATDFRIDGTSMAILNLPFNTNVSLVENYTIKDHSTFLSNGSAGKYDKTRSPTWTPYGKVGGAYNFTGSEGDFIMVDKTELWNFTDNFTFVGWINLNETHYTDSIFSSGSWGDMYLYHEYGYLKFHVVGLGDLYMYGIVTPNNWIHVAASYNATHMMIYVNGTLMNSTNHSGGPDTVRNNTLCIGATTDAVGCRDDQWPDGFSGMLDELMFFDRTLSPQQINAIYQAGLRGVSLRTIVSEETAVGQNWTACVTPSNGAYEGETVCSNAVSINELDCMNLTQANNIYTLTKNLSILGDTCFRVQAPNITIDCAGHSITGNNTPDTSAVYSTNPSENYNYNTTVKNCVISNFSRGVYYNWYSTDGLIYNNTFNITYDGGNAIHLQYYSHGTRAVGNTIYFGNGAAIYVSADIANNTIDCQGNNITGNGSGYGVLSSGAQNLMFTNCNMRNFHNSFYAYSGSTYGVLSNSRIINSSGTAIDLDDNNYLNISNVSVIGGYSPLQTASNGVYVNGMNLSPDYYTGLVIYSSNGNYNNVFINMPTDAWSAVGLSDGAKNNSFNNMTIVINSSQYGISIGGEGADNNRFNGLSLTRTNDAYDAIYVYNGENTSIDCQGGIIRGSNTSYGVLSLRPGTIVNNCRFEWWDNSIRLMGATNGLFTNNTFIPKSGSVHVYLNASSTGNTFILNNFTNTTGAYVNDTNGSNYYNGTFEGLNQGNIWNNVITGEVAISGNMTSSRPSLFIGTNGSGYPYNITNSLGKLYCEPAGCADYAPLTPTNSNPPAITMVVLNSTSFNNHTNDNLTLHFTQSGSGNISNATDWRMNGTSIAVLNMPFNTNISTNATGAVKDYSTHGNNGTIAAENPTYAPTWVNNGKVGGAYQFTNTIGSYIEINNTEYKINLSKPFTITAWIYETNEFSNAVITGGFFDDLQIYTHDTDIYFSLPGTTLFAYGSNGASRWIHVAADYNGTHMKLYINGTLYNSTNMTMSYPVRNNVMCIGVRTDGTRCRIESSQAWFDGMIDELQIYNRSLSPQQIQTIYQAGLNNQSLTTIVHQETVVGENWSSCVTASDGTDDSSTVCSNNVAINNGIPTVSNVILNATSSGNYSTDNLTVYFTQSDADGDTVYNVTDWRKNGQSIAVLNMPFNTNFTSTSNATRGVIDYSSFGNNGSLGNSTAGTQPTWNSSGKVGGAYTFDGVNDYIQVSEVNVTSIPPFSTSVWINHKYGNGSVINKYVSGSYNGYMLFVRNNKVCALNYRSPSDYAIFTENDCIPINQNQWYHVSTTLDTSGISIYINGQINKTMPWNGTYGSTNSTMPLLIGAYHFSGGGLLSTYFFNGTIDEVQIYNRSLSPEQVYQLYLSGLNNKSLTTIVRNETVGQENWTACVTPSDGYQDGATVCSNTLNVKYNTNLTINYPKTTNAYTGLGGYTLPISFNLTVDAVPTTTGITINQILINNTQCNLTYTLYENYTQFYDTFTDSNGVYLESHTPNTGTGWQEVYEYGGALAINIQSNVAYSTGNGYSRGSIYKMNTTPLKENYTLRITASNVDDTRYASSLFVRWVDSNNHYGFTFTNGVDSIEKQCKLYKRVSGVYTLLDSSCASYPSNGDIIDFKIVGNNIEIRWDGSLQLNATDSSLTSAGVAAIGLGATPQDDYLGMNTQHFDNAYLLIHNYSIPQNYTSGNTYYVNCTIPTLADGTYDLNVSINRTPGNGVPIIAVEEDSIIIQNNFAPVMNISVIYPNPAYTNDTLRGYCNATDADDATVYYHWSFFLNGELNTSGTSGPITASTLANVANISSSILSIGQNWTLQCVADDLIANSSGLNSSIKTIQARIPEKVTLKNPTNLNYTVHARQPVFEWYTTSHTTQYQINITSSTGCGGNYYQNVTFPTLTFIPTNELCVDTEGPNTHYDWQVRACGDDGCGNWSDKWNFSIEPWVIITIVNNSVNFSSLALGETKNTTQGSPGPFVLRNDGNVPADLINASSEEPLWVSVGLNTLYYQIKARESEEAGSFNLTSSITGWTNVGTSNISLINQLNYSDTKDSAYVDVQITVPGDEPPGEKQSNIIFSWEQSP